MSSSANVRVRRKRVRTIETRTIESTGHEMFNLANMLGPTGIDAFAKVLEDSAKIEREQGLTTGTLAWKKLGAAHYQRVLSGAMLPAALEGVEVTVQLRVSRMLSEVEYNSRLVSSHAVQTEKIKEGVQRAVNLEINKVVAMTVAQQVQQRIRQQVQVQGKVDMRVESNLTHRVTAALRH